MTRSGRRIGGAGSLLFVLLLAAAVWLSGGLRQRVTESGYQAIETNQSRLDPGRTWVDPRWEDELRRTLAGLGPRDAADPEGRAEIVDTVAALSFVATTGAPEILWPDSLRVPVQFQNPVACIAVGEAYYAVSADGTVLSGSWDRPPRVGPGWLPVIGAVGTHYPDARPGDVLTGEVERDAISIAVALWVHLDAADLETLGRALIDAARGRETGPLEPGARLYLERGREVWFGRPPRAGAPGSVPVDVKLANLSRALAFLRDGEDQDAEGTVPTRTWDWVDLRWDRPEIRFYGTDEAETGAEIEALVEDG